MSDHNQIPPKDLSATQFRVLKFIIDFRDRHGRSPSGGELADHFAWQSTTSAYKHVKALIREGYLTAPMQSSRLNTWKLTAKGQRYDPQALPLLGRIPEGSLDDAIATEAAMILHLRDLLPDIKDTDLFYRITTDIFIEKALPKGSLIIARPNMDISNGDLIVLNYTQRLLLRFISFQKNNLILKAANRGYDDIIVPSEQVNIYGTVIATIHTRDFAS